MVRLILTILVAALSVAVAIPAASESVDIIDPVPVMVLTGYSQTASFRSPSSIFVDKKRGDIWVADSGNHQIVAFDVDGIPLLKFRHRALDPASGEPYLGRPTSLVVDSLGQVFVADGASDNVAMYDYRGRLIKRINVAKLLGVEQFRAFWLEIDDSDNLYVAEAERPFLAVLNRDQELVDKIDLSRAQAKAEADKGQQQPVESMSGLSIGRDGRIYLLNSADHPCVRVVDATGKELVAFGDVDAGWTNFVRPAAVVSIDDGTFWVADAGSNIVKQFSPKGDYRQYIGGGPGTRPGEMRYPTALATDGKSRLYVAESGTNRVQVFSLLKRDAAAGDSSKTADERG